MCVSPRPFIPALQTMRIQLVYTLYSQRIENVFHVLSGGGLLTTDLDRVEGVFAAWWNASARAQVSTSVSLVLIVADALNINNGLHKEYTTGWLAPGSFGSAALPANNTTAVKLSTAFSGRSFRGRIYWPGIPSSPVTGGLISTGYRDAIVAALNTLRTNLAAGGDALAIVSYCSGGAWRSGAVVTPVTACSGHTTINSQRRRTVGGA